MANWLVLRFRKCKRHKVTTYKCLLCNKVISIKEETNG
jgi:hypothetical protein